MFTPQVSFDMSITRKRGTNVYALKGGLFSRQLTHVVDILPVHSNRLPIIVVIIGHVRTVDWQIKHAPVWPTNPAHWGDSQGPHGRAQLSFNLLKCVQLYIYIYIYIYIYCGGCKCKCGCVRMHMCIFVFMHVYVNEYIYKYICVCAYACVYVCVHLHNFTRITPLDTSITLFK